MSLNLFPSLRGLTFGTQMTPRFNTGITQSVSGHETRNSYQVYPLWDFELSYEWLPNRVEGRADLERIVSFFLERGGSFEAFLFDAPETPMEDMILLGTGDGALNEFDLLKSTGSFIEPAGGVYQKTDVQIYVDSIMVGFDNFNLSDHRTISFDTIPTEGQEVRGCYKPLYRVRFGEDSAQFDQFMHRLWELQQLSLKGIFS